MLDEEGCITGTLANSTEGTEIITDWALRPVLNDVLIEHHGTTDFSAVHTIGLHRIIEKRFSNGTPYFIPLSYVPGREGYFNWTLDAAIISSIAYHNNSLTMDAWSCAMARRWLNVRDEE